MRSSLRKSFLGGLIAIFTLATLLVGCGVNNESANNEPQNKGTGNKPSATTEVNTKEPTEISIMLPSTDVTPPAEGNLVQLELEKRTNTKLDFQWVAGAYADKANVTLASGELPDLMVIMSPDIYGNTFRSMANQGAFWDIAPYIKDYPNMTALPETLWKKITMDGKIYGVPRPRSLEGASFYLVRKDWLDNLGLEMPTNHEELYEVWKAFTYDDPDKNGKDDTIGFAGTLNHLGVFQNLMTQASGIYGSATARWKLQDNELINTALLPATREALILSRKIVEEKLVPEDAATIKDAQVKNLFESSKAGTGIYKSFSAYDLQNTLVKIDPNALVVPIPVLNDYAPQDLGFLNMIAISKEVPEDEMKKMLEFLDYGLTVEAYELAQWGIKDIHYTEADGVRTITDKYKTDSLMDFIHLLYRYDRFGNTIRENMPPEMKEELKKTVDLKEKVSVPDYSFGLQSETELKAGVELYKKIDDMKTRVLLGKDSIESWDAFVEELKANPDFTKITQELNDSYKAINGN